MSSYNSYRLLLWNIVNKRCLTKSSSLSASADRRPLLGIAQQRTSIATLPKTQTRTLLSHSPIYAPVTLHCHWSVARGAGGGGGLLWYLSATRNKGSGQQARGFRFWLRPEVVNLYNLPITIQIGQIGNFVEHFCTFLDDTDVWHSQWWRRYIENKNRTLSHDVPQQKPVTVVVRRSCNQGPSPRNDEWL